MRGSDGSNVVYDAAGAELIERNIIEGGTIL